MRLILIFTYSLIVISSYANVPKNLYSAFLKQDFKVTPSEKLPQELRHIITNISRLQLTDSEKTSYIESLILIDAHASKLNKEELLFLGKSEILKSLIKGRARLKVKKRSHNPRILLEINSWLKNDKLSSFSKWFLTALHKDLQIQFQSPFFRQFMLMKIGNKRITDLELRKLEKRFNLLLPWYEDYKEKGPEFFQQDLKPLLLTTLTKVTKYYGLLAKYSHLPQELKLSTFEKLTSIKVEIQTIKEEKKSTFSTLFPDPDPNYKAPEALPQAVDTWMPLDDMPNLKAEVPENLFPKADPTYKAPEKLPEPVNDWLLNL